MKRMPTIYYYPEDVRKNSETGKFYPKYDMFICENEPSVIFYTWDVIFNKIDISFGDFYSEDFKITYSENIDPSYTENKDNKYTIVTVSSSNSSIDEIIYYFTKIWEIARINYRDKKVNDFIYKYNPIIYCERIAHDEYVKTIGGYVNYSFPACKEFVERNKHKIFYYINIGLPNKHWYLK